MEGGGRRALTRASLLAAVLLLSSRAEAQGASKSINKLESRQLPPGAVTRRVLDQLDDILVPLPHHLVRQNQRPPRRALSELWYVTRLHAGWSPGVCVQQLVIFRFHGPDNGAEANAATPVRVSDIDATTQFHVDQPHRGGADAQLDQRSRAAHEDRCAHLDPVSTETFRAADERMAVAGAWAYASLLRAQASHDPAVQITCSGDNDQGCGALFNGLNSSSLKEVRPCRGAHTREQESCLDLSSGDVEMEAFSDPDARLLRAHATAMLVFGDWKVD